METLSFITSHLDKSPTIIILGVVLWLTKSFWKEHRRTCDAHKKDYSALAERSNECIDKNTEASTKLSEAVRDLAININKH